VDRTSTALKRSKKCSNLCLKAARVPARQQSHQPWVVRWTPVVLDHANIYSTELMVVHALVKSPRLPTKVRKEWSVTLARLLKEQFKVIV
jgi:hypothetical protein